MLEVLLEGCSVGSRRVDTAQKLRARIQMIGRAVIGQGTAGWFNFSRWSGEESMEPHVVT